MGILEAERGGLLDGQEALLAGLQSVEAEAEDHEERLAVLEGEAERLAALEEDMGRLSTLEEEVFRLGRRLVQTLASRARLDATNCVDFSCGLVGMAFCITRLFVDLVFVGCICELLPMWPLLAGCRGGWAVEARREGARGAGRRRRVDRSCEGHPAARDGGVERQDIWCACCVSSCPPALHLI